MKNINLSDVIYKNDLSHNPFGKKGTILLHNNKSKTMETKGLYQLHEEHKQWLNNLNFYKDEIAIMQNRIAEIAAKNSSKEVLANVEHFQNQLIVQKEQMDILSHEIKLHEQSLEKEVNKNETAIDHRKFPSHPEEAEKIKTFDTMFDLLRKELNVFLSKNM
jgi:hypothetical protein